MYVSTPKAGTHTFYHLLETKFDGRQKEGPYHQNIIDPCYKEFFKFTSVRHPFSRAVSIWHSLLFRERYRDLFLGYIGGDSFLEFARWLSRLNENNRPRGRGGVMLPPQSEWLKGLSFDKIIKIENINFEFNDLPFVSEKLGEIPVVLKRDHQSWNDVCCDESRDLLSRYYERDLMKFKYGPEVL